MDQVRHYRLDQKNLSCLCLSITRFVGLQRYLPHQFGPPPRKMRGIKKFLGACSRAALMDMLGQVLHQKHLFFDRPNGAP
jgi:hypothetical protein